MSENKEYPETTISQDLKALKKGYGLHDYTSVVNHLLNRVAKIEMEMELQYQKGYNHGYHHGEENAKILLLNNKEDENKI